MRDLLQRYGFKPAGSCNCGGIYTEKFRCDNYLIRVRVRRYKFAVYDGGMQALNWTDLDQLEIKLNEIFPKDKTTVEAKA